MAEHQHVEMLKAALARIMRRLNLLRMEFCLTRVYVVGLLLAALVLFLNKTFLITTSKWLPLLIVLITGAIGLEWWRRRRANLFEAAMEADQQLGLKEKLSSGVAFADPLLVRRKVARAFHVDIEKAKHPMMRKLLVVWSRVLALWARILPPTYMTPSWAQRESKSDLVPALVVDAAERANKVNPRQVLPWRADWRLYSVGVAELAALLFLVTWSGKDLRPPEQRAVGKALEVEGKKLEEIAKQNKELAKGEKMSDAKKAALELAKLGKQMQDKRMQKKDAMLKMDELNKEMEKLSEKAAQKEEGKEVTNLQKLAEALKEEQLQDQNSQELAKSLAQQNMAEAKSALDNMMKQMKNEKMSEKQKQQLAKELEQMAKGLEKAGAKDLAKQMQQLAQSMKAGNMANMKMNAQALSNMMNNMQLSKEQMEALQQMAQNLKMSQMNLAQSDQKCEFCDGTGKG